MLHIILLNMPEVSRVFALLIVPVHVFEPVVQDRVGVPDGAEVAFEVLNVGRIETNEGCVAPDVEFGHLGPEDVGAAVVVGDLL